MTNLIDSLSRISLQQDLPESIFRGFSGAPEAERACRALFATKLSKIFKTFKTLVSTTLICQRFNASKFVV
jgi:hypothetical protein